MSQLIHRGHFRKESVSSKSVAKSESRVLSLRYTEKTGALRLAQSQSFLLVNLAWWAKLRSA